MYVFDARMLSIDIIFTQCFANIGWETHKQTCRQYGGTRIL